MLKEKKFNINAAKAKARKIAAGGQREELEAREKEDEKWRKAEGPKSRAAKKREEEAEKRAAAAARKAENRRLAKQEEKELQKALWAKSWAAESLKYRNANQTNWNKWYEEYKKTAEYKRIRDSSRGIKTEDKYKRMVGGRNMNHRLDDDDLVIEDYEFEEAISQLGWKYDLTNGGHKHFMKHLNAMERGRMKSNLWPLVDDDGIDMGRSGLEFGDYDCEY